METTALFPLVETACRHLLSAQDRDPFSLTYGCFDRRYWAWKLVDFPEATFQRNVYPLAWYLKTKPGREMESALIKSISAGLQFAENIQHKNGSFDQAFPNEFSFGATAFLLHPMLEALKVVAEFIPEYEQKKYERSLYRAADFLYTYNETHGHIANHLAGGALSLYSAANLFSESRFASRADLILEKILAGQSNEGWFVEYEGADPGYQSLCLYYLAQVYQVRPSPELRRALDLAIYFMSHFIHPDGTYGGEYGSRRTAVYYPGGVALLSAEIPMAASMTRFMVDSILSRHTITVQDVDMGNLAPLLSNYVLAISAKDKKSADALLLPCEQDSVKKDFNEGGLFVRGTAHYYAVLGASNGGVLKVFDRASRKMFWNDAGYVGQDLKERWVTTQMTMLDNKIQVAEDVISLDVPFYIMRRELPSPWRFVLLRLLNLTAMLNMTLGNWVKAILANMLIVGKSKFPASLKRVVKFGGDFIEVYDQIRSDGSRKFKWLSYGQPFVAIHMASAKYFENENNVNFDGIQIPVKQLNEHQIVETQVKI